MSENWFSVNEKEPVAYVRVEVIEASGLKPSDLNGQFTSLFVKAPYLSSFLSFDDFGFCLYFMLTKEATFSGLADPYVKGQLGPFRFKTKIQRKTLDPKWHEEFKIPIVSWETPNMLSIEVRDKDHFVDDTLGFVSIL